MARVDGVSDAEMEEEEDHVRHYSVDSPAVEKNKMVRVACLAEVRNAADHHTEEKAHDGISDRRTRLAEMAEAGDHS